MATVERRILDDDSTSYRARVRLHGARPASAPFSRKTDALKWAVDSEAAIRAGRHFKSDQARQHTVHFMRRARLRRPPGHVRAMRDAPWHCCDFRTRIWYR